MCDTVGVGTAYKCRAYPDQTQQQALRHQHQAYSAFFARRARYPRFKPAGPGNPRTTPAAAFTMRGGELRLAKMSAPLRFVWSWPDVDVTTLDPAMVIVRGSRTDAGT